MPRDGSGNYTQPSSSVSPAVTNTTISSVDFNNLMTDFSSEMTDSFDRSGKGAMLAAVAMGGFRINNLGAPGTGSDAARLDNITGFTLVGDVTGTPGANVVSNVPAGITEGLTGGSFAGAGKVGRVFTNSGTIGLTTGTPANITSITPGAGNWLIFGTISTGPGGATTTTGFHGAINLTTATIASGVGNSFFDVSVSTGSLGPAGTVNSLALPSCVVSITTNTTYFLNVQAGFAGGAMNAGGVISAIRIG